MNTLLIAGLTILGSLSPLLTFTALWQLKEWRVDRLREHLVREGWWNQLFGTIRPIIVAAWLVTLLLLLLEPYTLTLLCVATLAGLTLMQMGVRRQRLPVWTTKAKAICGVAVLMMALLSLAAGVSAPLFLPFIVLIQPAMVAFSWALFLPIDRHLKRRIMDRARQARMRCPDLRVIGITGSVGKTTTKELLAHLLQDLHPLVTPAHVNSEMGVAQWLIKTLGSQGNQRIQRSQGMGASLDYPVSPDSLESVLVVEMGAYREGEIALMSSYVQQTIGVVTFAGGQHVALFGSEEALFRAKSELVTHLPATGHAYLNGDNDACRQMRELSPCPTTLVGTGGSADLEAYDIEETTQGVRFQVLGDTFSVPLHGTHNVTNILLAIAVARDLGIATERMQTLLKTFAPPAHTFSVREERSVTLLDDTHNSSPASVKAAIAWARSQPAEEKVLILSGLLEVGEGQERIEREIGASAAGIFQRIIVINKRSSRTVALGAGAKVEHLVRETKPVKPGALLVCVGRMPLSTVQRLLPPAI